MAKTLVVVRLLVGVVIATARTPVRLILDTDIGGGGCMDVDDVAAICLANALADNGEAVLLAVVQNTSPPPCAGAISVLNNYYGRDEVPIGAYKGTDLSPDAKYLSYVTDLSDNWPSSIKNSSQVPSSVEVYRRVLAEQPDHSVTISSIGLLTNLAALLSSPPDQVSPLSGAELVARKVASLVVMGGKYPTSGTSPECNFCGCYNGATIADSATASAASGYVFSHIPPEVKILFSGFEIGIAVQSGGKLSSCAPASNPCRQAFIDFEGGPGRSRFSWDPLNTLVAVRGAAAASCAECTDCDGSNKVDGASGNNAWVPGAAANQTYLVLRNATAAGNAIDELLCQQPVAKKTKRS
ncbi:hypothetical protein CYMTET_18313 [Cymbomonas tetramitiformis]|uniref:Inosine/uridine-preferring nucleoside hydrolase domain-containing protein n=1 Tax=Cymbomonas tetramitiformis TaxID=36881 RepID=A0AAE0G8H9_9CHLO|nr:hypothetical protein CYMTET_18313 [Cymbomonas tetramitiformis]|eukprot:gene6473-7761_t